MSLPSLLLKPIMSITDETTGEKNYNKGFVGGNVFEILKEVLLTSSFLPNEFFLTSF